MRLERSNSAGFGGNGLVLLSLLGRLEEGCLIAAEQRRQTCRIREAEDFVHPRLTEVGVEQDRLLTRLCHRNGEIRGGRRLPLTGDRTCDKDRLGWRVDTR